MNFWKMMNTRWDRESIRGWSSLQKTSYILLPLLIYFLIHDIVAEVLLWAALNLFMQKAGEPMRAFLNRNGYTVRGIIGGAAILIGIAVIWKGVKEEIRGESRDLPARRPDEKVGEYMLLTVFAFFLALGMNLLFNLMGMVERSEAFSQVVKAQYGVDFFCGLALYGILSPFAEEAVFRGLIYNRMKRCFHQKIALACSALIFGVYHGNLVQAAYGTILGYWIAYIYESYQSFAAPVLFHAVANVSIFALTYQNNLSGMTDRRTQTVISIVCLLSANVCLFFIQKRNGAKARKNSAWNDKKSENN